jgi:hypothetical protein
MNNNINYVIYSLFVNNRLARSNSMLVDADYADLMIKTLIIYCFGVEYAIQTSLCRLSFSLFTSTALYCNTITEARTIKKYIFLFIQIHTYYYY